MSVVRTLAWCFHVLEMSGIHTGEHTKQQRFKLRYISQSDRLPLLSVLYLLLFIIIFDRQKHHTLTKLCPTSYTPKTGRAENNAFTLYIIELAI